jgi:transcriptional antiterminator NusG
MADADIPPASLVEDNKCRAGALGPGLEPDGYRWFAVWTRSRHERAVYDQLTERGIQAFYPTVPRWSRWKDRKKKIDWPLFPGYCFAHIEPPGRLAVLKCAGVVSIVSFNGELAPVSDHEIEGIKTLINSALPYDPCPMLKTGTKVEVVHGPLKGVVGKLQRKGPHTRLVLSVDLIGRGVSVQVDAADVREL